MKTSEKLKALAALYEAQESGKQLQRAHPSFGWRDELLIVEVDIDEFEPTLWRVKPEEPPKPSQEWLDKHGVELTGECRVAVTGELTHCIDFGTTNARYDIDPMVITTIPGIECCPRWILRRRPPVEKWEPWTIDDVPLPLVVRSRDQPFGRIVLGTILSADDHGQLQAPHGDWITFQTLLEKYVQRDGQPCGRKV